MSSFKKLNTKIFQKTGPVITPDYIYWKKQGVSIRDSNNSKLTITFKGSGINKRIWTNRLH